MVNVAKDRVGIQREAIRRRGLAAFVRYAWPRVEPGELDWNWHIDLLCRELEMVQRRETRNLTIWVPPGSMKTLLTGVFFPAWTWTIDPSRRQIHSTYGQNLAIKAARQHRKLIMTGWYSQRWPGAEIPMQNTHASAWFENASSGSRFSGSVGGEVTGRHAHDLMGDDLNKSMDATVSPSPPSTRRGTTGPACSRPGRPIQ